jgi:hypothetical protein
MKPGLTPRVQFHITQSSTQAVERKTRQNVEEPSSMKISGKRNGQQIICRFDKKHATAQ